MKPTAIPGFDVLRLVAALLVLMQHSYAATGIWDREWFVVLTGRQLSGGSIGVGMFFIISGYLVQQSLERNRGLIAFVRARALRIFPGLAWVLIATVLVIGPLASSLSARDYFADGNAWKYLANLRLFPLEDSLPGVFQQNVLKGAVNGSLWTLPYEVTCYVMLYVMALASGSLRKIAFFVFALLALLLWTAYEYSLVPKLTVVVLGGINSRDLAGFAALFFAGSALSQLAPKHLMHPGLALAAFALWVGGVMLGQAKLVTLLALPMLTLSLALHLSWGASLRERVGDLSYGAYLWAFPVQQLLAMPGPLQVRQPELHLLLTLAIVLPLAWLSWHAVERPALRWKVRS